MNAPAWQFYASDDFLANVNVMLLTAEERGMWISLKAWYWCNGPLPFDLDSLARLCNCSSQAFEAAWIKLSKCFSIVDLDNNGQKWIIHPGLLDKREQQLDKSERNVENGREGAKRRKEKEMQRLARLKQEIEAGYSQAEARLSPSSSPSSSTSSSDKTNESCPADAGRVDEPTESQQLSLVPPDESPSKTDKAAECFAEFWKLYPRKEAKADAEKAFRANVKSTKVFRAVMAGLQAQLPDMLGKDRQYVKLPAGWLRAKRWEDAPPAPPVEDDEFAGCNFLLGELNLHPPGWINTPEGQKWERWCQREGERFIAEGEAAAAKQRLEDERRWGKPPADESPYPAPSRSELSRLAEMEAERERLQEQYADDPDTDPPDYGYAPVMPRHGERRSQMTSVADAAERLLAKIGGAA